MLSFLRDFSESQMGRNKKRWTAPGLDPFAPFWQLAHYWWHSSRGFESGWCRNIRADGCFSRSSLGDGRSPRNQPSWWWPCTIVLQLMGWLRIHGRRSLKSQSEGDWIEALDTDREPLKEERSFAFISRDQRNSTPELLLLLLLLLNTFKTKAF